MPNGAMANHAEGNSYTNTKTRISTHELPILFPRLQDSDFQALTTETSSIPDLTEHTL